MSEYKLQNGVLCVRLSPHIDFVIGVTSAIASERNITNRANSYCCSFIPAYAVPFATKMFVPCPFHSVEAEWLR